MTASPRPWRRALAWLAALGPFFYLSYGLANHLASRQGEAVSSVVFDWEHQVPFWGWTIFPYWSLNLFYALSVLLPRTRHELDRHGLRLLGAQCIAVACFVAFPLRFSFGQPAVDGAAGWLFAALRGFDQPYNQAPSLHIALAVILWDMYRRHLESGAARALLAGWMLAICASVLTTWQHHFIDIPTGALLGVLCVWAWPLERRLSPLRAWRLSRDARRRRLALNYAAGALLACAAALVWRGAALWLLWPALSLTLVSLAYLGLGARAFSMARDGRMAWPARVLLAPYLLGARLNGRWWTRRDPSSREVVPGVWLASLARLQGGSGQVVVSLCAEMQVPGSAGGRCLPWLDLVPASPPALRRAAAVIEAARRSGSPVVVGCALGFSRSVAALACWLTRQGHARDLDDAIARLQRVQPRLVLGAEWREALRRAVAA